MVFDLFGVYSVFVYRLIRFPMEWIGIDMYCEKLLLYVHKYGYIFTISVKQILTRKWKQNTLIVKLTDINFVLKTSLEAIL